MTTSPLLTRPLQTLLLAGCLGVPAAQATTLYDPNLNTTPTSQGWTFLSAGIAPYSVSGGALSFNTTAFSATQAGFSRTDLSLDSDVGFDLSFRLQVVSEAHGNNNRAGFSVIALDNLKQGIELSFWTDQIWVQSGPSFTKAESAALNTTSAIDYGLRLLDGFYSLEAQGSQVLSGVMRDYSSFGVPYNVPNFLFFGDNTTSSQAQVLLGEVALRTPVPEPSTVLLLGLGLLVGLRPLSRLGAVRREAHRPSRIS